MTIYLTSLRKLFLTFVALSIPLVAQSGLGIVTGTVKDPSKAEIPKATVTLTNTATAVTRTSTSNDAGLYYFGGMPVGAYHLTVEASGFAKWETDFQIQAGQTVTVDATLPVGTVQSKVDVSGAASQIATEGSQLSDVKTAQTIHDLPLNGRQVSLLFTLTPGVEGGQNTQDGGNPRTNGMMVGSTEMLLDGVSYVDRFGGGISRVQPGLDTIQEYRIETAGSGASFDRPATIELVTRSGTNQFHGAAFETLRDNYGGLVARAVQDGNTPAKLIRNEFGGWVGGPIKKNKTFFFYDQELLKQRQEVFAQTAVPTAAMWNGDFSNATDTSGNKITIYNPYTTNAQGVRQPFAGNIIPQTVLDTPVINVFKGISPVPSGPNATANPWTGLNFQTFYPNTTDTNTLTGRLDQVFSDKDSLSARYTQAFLNSLLAGGRYGYPPPGVTNGTGTEAQKANVFSIVTHWTHTFSPTLLNELQLSAHRSSDTSGTNGLDVNWDAKLGLPNPFGATGWPTVYTDAYNMFYYGGWDGDNRKDQQLTQYQIDDSATWVKGKHTFKFGFKGRQEFNNVRELQQAQGSDTFDSPWTGLYDASAQAIAPFTGSGLASLELGLPGYLSNQYNRGYFYFQQKEIGFYGEDSWKLSPKLTVSLGLRWEFWTPYKEKQNRLVNLNLNTVLSDPASMQVVLPGNTTLNSIPGLPTPVINAWAARGLTAVTANSIGFPSALTPNVWDDISPHLAVAYRLSDKWVLRGGYGTYYFPMPLSQILQAMRVNPPLNLRYQNSIDDLNGTNGVYALTVIPSPADKIGGATVSPSAVNSSAQGFLPMNVNRWADNRIQEWTFTIERELASNLVLKLAYTGNHGSNLQQHWDYNAPLSVYNYQAQTGVHAPTLSYLRQPNPNWSILGGDGALEHNGYSNSNSVQAVLDKRFSSGLSFQFFYVYTHAMTTNDAGGFTSGGGSINANTTGGSSGTSGSVPANTEILNNPSLSDSQRLRFLYTNSSQVPPQRITWNGIYQLPFGRGKKFLGNSGRAMDALVGGWQVAFIGTWASGFWIGNSSTEYQFHNPSLSSGERQKLNIFGQNQMLWFAGDFDPTQAAGVNPASLEQFVPVNRGARNIHPLGAKFDNRVPQTLANGTVVQTSITDNLSWNARNYMLGPRQWDQDVSAFKYFNITERVRLRMSGDFFNVFNHPNLNSPNPTTGLVNLSSQPNSPRIIQVGARLEF
ncbi:MAG TPA: TonB-dependent receptor [Bryobacteraceae bacterium]|nr:TonB-dependent receptor [Bryobacteraceae bacterium]